MIALRLAPLSLVLVMGIGLAACEDTRQRGAARHSIPLPNDVLALMAAKGTTPRAPVLLRSFKKESELEVWKMGANGQYALLKSYPICRWSGQLGPKKREGDRQAPEGFYTITPAQMNPNSSFYLSFNMGFPNAFDRAHGRTGAHLMVHGACSSSGCYSMSDDQIAEIYAIVREAHQGGQQGVQMQALPFRMTAENLARHRYDPNMPFWRNLKEGVDMFEVAKAPPRVSVCQARYAFNRTEDCNEDPAARQIVAAAAEKRRQDEAKVAALIASGTQAVRVVYQDGGQHAKFTQVLMSAGPEALEQKTAWGSRAVGVSRPDALLAGPQEVAMASPAAPQGITSRGTLAPARGPQTPRIAQPRGQQPSADEPASTGQTEVARAAIPAPEAEGSSALQRLMSFSLFTAPQPATATFTPASPAVPAAPRRLAKPTPQASLAPGIRVAKRPAGAD